MIWTVGRVRQYVRAMYLVLAKYQGVAPGCNGWKNSTPLKTFKIQNGDIFAHREIFFVHLQKNVKLQQTVN